LIDDTLYDAFGQREVTQYFTQLASYYVIEEVPPELQGKPDTLNKIYLKSPITGQEVPLSTFVKYTTRPIAFLSHRGHLWGRSDSTPAVPSWSRQRPESAHPRRRGAFRRRSLHSRICRPSSWCVSHT